ncbi:hypothetical protein F5Y14DRAFT_450602 [Nemania sp. NC0429]|nr:hypothetical protein F5Y14DRAFT_450602 [Nemania sp. NC0429]
MPGNLLDDPNGVISRLVARRNDAAAEAARARGKEMMARAALRLAGEARTRLRANLQAEFDKIAKTTREDIETIRQAAREEQQMIGHDIGFVQELLRANVDILNDYGVLQPSEEHNAGATLEPDTANDASAAVATKSMRPTTFLKPDDNQNQATDAKDDEGDKKNAAVCREGKSAPSKYLVGPDTASSSGSLSPWPSSNTQGRSDYKVVIDSDDEIQTPCDSQVSAHPGDVREGVRPGSGTSGEEYSKIYGTLMSNFLPAAARPVSRSTRPRSRRNSSVQLVKDEDPKNEVKIYRRRSLIRPWSSQAAASSQISDPLVSSPQQSSRLAGATASACQETPDSQRRSARLFTPVKTYNDKKIFRNMVGSLDGPEYVLPTSQY